MGYAATDPITRFERYVQRIPHADQRSDRGVLNGLTVEMRKRDGTWVVEKGR